MANNIEDIDKLSRDLISYLRYKLKNPSIEYTSMLTRLFGGYQTLTYRFQLKAVENEWAKPMVLRIYPSHLDSEFAIWESTIQNVLWEEGFPVAKVYFVCTDSSILGGKFIIMECLPGQILADASPEIISEVLGKAHAELHDIDPTYLIKKLSEKGIDENRYKLHSQFEWLRDRAMEFPWARDVFNWLIENRPLEPGQLSICHRDFHVGNILLDKGKVSGILDWGGLLIADPAFDVANTVNLHMINAKHVSAIENNSPIDWNLLTEAYLATYQKYKPLDNTHLDFYRVTRGLTFLLRSFMRLFIHDASPLIGKDLITHIHKVTGLLVEMPD